MALFARLAHTSMSDTLCSIHEEITFVIYFSMLETTCNHPAPVPVRGYSYTQGAAACSSLYILYYDIIYKMSNTKRKNGPFWDPFKRRYRYLPIF